MTGGKPREGGRNILLVVSYDGTGFSGWQRLGGGARTVQKTLEDGLSASLGEKINVIGAGRTDAGVHAEGQAANFRTSSALSPEHLAERLDAALPPDLACIMAREAVPAFHARYRALSKTYAYRFHDGPRRDPFESRWSLHVPRRLDENAMAEACKRLVGESDFSALTNAKDDARAFVRRIIDVRVERRGDLVEAAFRADGFLYNQARIMAACALEAGLGRMSPDTVSRIVEARDRSAAPGALGAYGLRLVRVEYPDGDFLDPAPLLPTRADGPPPGQALDRSSDRRFPGTPLSSGSGADRRPL